jgi:ATP-dependent helicase/DNAse subunit B
LGQWFLLNDFLHCPRLYYLRNVYKDPITRNRLTIITPPLALGQAVHEVIDSISHLPSNERLSISLSKRLEEEWKKVKGKLGGFKSKNDEDESKQRALGMLKKIEDNPGPIIKKAVKIKSEDELPPRFWLSEEDGIILNGKIDWLEFLPKTNSLHIIDFKTGRREESDNSLQLPIYHLLASALQKRKVSKASYWYLDFENKPKEIILPDPETSASQILKIGRRVKLARPLERFVCPKGGCMFCLPYEEILKGNGKKVSQSSYQDIYVLV